MTDWVLVFLLQVQIGTNWSAEKLEISALANYKSCVEKLVCTDLNTLVIKMSGPYWYLEKPCDGQSHESARKTLEMP